MEQLLGGIKVLDLTHYIAGPYCTKLLADFGAEVIKVEKPGIGDPARSMGPFPGDIPDAEKSGLFLFLNTSKKGITLNLKSATGIEIFKQLVKEADILVENFSPRVMPSLGLDYSTLERINHKLVMTSISNFGQSGPYRDFRMTEIVADAMGGWMTMVGEPDREPLKPGGEQALHIAGLYAAVATMTALHYQEDTGIGQQVDVSIMEAVLYTQMNITSMYSYTGEVRKRIGNMMFPFPCSVQPCKDGYIGLFAVTNAQWQTFCRWMGMPELIDDPRFKDAGARSEHIDELSSLMLPWLIEHSQYELFHEAQARGLPFGLVASTQQLLNSPQLKARNYFVMVEHPAAGGILYPGAPFKVEGLRYQPKPAPLLGEHNEEVYCGRLGYTKADLVVLRERGVI